MNRLCLKTETESNLRNVVFLKEYRTMDSVENYDKNSVARVPERPPLVREVRA
jgi:hypothetical protein